MNDKPGYCDHHGTQVGMPCPFCGRLNMNPTSPTPKTHAEVADAIVERAKARGKGMVIVDREYEELENDIATALRDAHERGLTIGFDRGQGWAKTREGAMERAGLVFDGEDKIVTRHGTILDDDGNVRRDRLKEMREVRGWLCDALDRMELADVTRLPWLAAALTNSYQQLDAFIGEREAALHAKDAHAGE